MRWRDEHRDCMGILVKVWSEGLSKSPAAQSSFQ
jgi:hypothetical protein